MYGRMMFATRHTLAAAQKIGSCCLALLKTFGESLQRDVKTDLVPMFEAVGYGLRHRKDAGGHPFNPEGLLTER